MTSPSNHLLAPSPLPCHVEFKWRTRMTRSVDSCEFYFDMFRQDDLTSTEYVMRQLYPWNMTSTIHCFALVARSVNNRSEASWFNDTTIHEANYLKSCFISGTNGGVFFENAIYDQGLMNELFKFSGAAEKFHSGNNSSNKAPTVNLDKAITRWRWFKLTTTWSWSV